MRASPENAASVYQALRTFGAPLSGVTPDDFAQEGYVFQIGIAPNRVDVLMSVDGMKFEDAWPNRVTVDFGGINAHLISRDDLVTIKRAAGRPQDLRDVASLLQEQDPA